MVTTFVILFMLMSGSDQASPEQFITLQADRTIAIGAEWNRPLYQGIRCDSRGRLYFRPYDRSNQKAVVVRVDADGGGAVRFAQPVSGELKSATIYDFTISPDGFVYELAQVEEQVYVVKFSNEGDASAPVLLQREFFAAHAVPLSEGRMLVIGSEAVPDGSKKPKRRPFTGVFDGSGRLLTEIAGLKEESSASKKDGSADLDDELGPSILLGTALAGPDGFIYILQTSNAARVLVLDHNIKKVRELSVDAPLQGMRATAMQVARGQIALLFVEQDSDSPVQRAILVVLDTTTGERLRSYDVSDIGLAFACFTGDSVSFLSSSGGKLAIKTAGLK